MELEAIWTVLIVGVIAFLFSVVVTFIVKKIHRILVFGLPAALSLVAIVMALYIFSNDAGFGVIILVGSW